MKIFHLISAIIGTLIIVITRLFWIEVCFVFFAWNLGLEEATCVSFKEFFFVLAVLSVIISLFNLFRSN